MKKLLCTILALVLTFALSLTALAADTVTIGIAQFAEHGSLDNWWQHDHMGYGAL